MSVHPFSTRPVRAVPVEPYYQSHPMPEPAETLRPLTTLEQMYAYWGSDRVENSPASGCAD